MDGAAGVHEGQVEGSLEAELGKLDVLEHPRGPVPGDETHRAVPREGSARGAEMALDVKGQGISGIPRGLAVDTVAYRHGCPADHKRFAGTMFLSACHGREDGEERCDNHGRGAHLETKRFDCAKRRTRHKSIDSKR